MSSLIKYSHLMDEIDSLVSRHQKRAADSDPSGMTTEDGDGDAVPSSKDDEDVVDQETMSPDRTDSTKKSVKYQDASGVDSRIVDDSISSVAEKAAKAGNNVLAQLYRMLNKKAEGEKSSDEDEREDESEEKIDEELAREILREAETTPEDEAEMSELGLKTASLRADYLLSKRAGQQAAIQHVKQAQSQQKGVQEFQKQAAYKAGQIVAQLDSQGHFNKQAAYKAGQIIAQLDSQGHFNKQASYKAGQIIAQLEKNGTIYSAASMEKIGQDLGAQMRGMIKEAYEKGRNEERRTHGVVKQAAADTTESVIHDILKRRMGQHVNP